MSGVFGWWRSLGLGLAWLGSASCGSFGGVQLAPHPEIPAPQLRGRVIQRDTIHLREPGDYDFGDVLHVWRGEGACDQREYQKPALHIHCGGVTVRGFAYSGAPDGVHVGDLEWNAANAVLPHREVRGVRLVGLQAVRICEDALTLQKNVHDVVVEDSHFWGGGDKQIQNDHGQGLRVVGSGFYGAVRAIRWKANTSGEVIGCRFVRCKTPIKADSQAWPQPAAPGRQRPGGPVYLTLGGNQYIECRDEVVVDEGVVVFRP